MQRRTLVLLLLLAVAIAAAGAWLVLDRPGAVRTGRTPDASISRPLPPFRRIAVEGFADVLLVEGASEAAVVDATAKGAAAVTLAVEGDTLTVTTGETRRWWQRFGAGPARMPRITITFRDLEALRLSGNVRLRAARIRVPALAVNAAGAASIRVEHLDVDALKLTGAGAIKADFAGRAANQRIELAGAGVFRGPDLAGQRVRVAVSGAGKASVRATETLDVAISGAGSVEYSGDPKITQDISGAGKIRRRSADDAMRAQVAGRPGGKAAPTS